MYTKAILVGGGDFVAEQFEADTDAFVIAVDKGYEYIKGLCAVDLVIGDFDSLGYVPLGKKTKIFPCEKDFTDMQLALKHCQQMQISNITIYGGLGGRLDHTIANLQNCLFYAKSGMNIVLKGAEDIYIITDHLDLFGYVGQTISVLALEQSEGVTFHGLKYNARNLSMSTDFPIGVSNQLQQTAATIKLASGALAVFVTK